VLVCSASKLLLSHSVVEASSEMLSVLPELVIDGKVELSSPASRELLFGFRLDASLPVGSDW